MPIRLGTTDIVDVRYGTGEVLKRYVGTTLVWERTTYTFPDTFNRADNASMGDPWFPRNGTNVMRITGNRAVPTTDTLDTTMQYGNYVHGLTGHVEAPARADDGFLGIQAFITLPFRNEIEFIIHPDGDFRIVEHNNGTEVIIDTAPGAGNVEYVLWLGWEVIAGTTHLYGYVDGDLVCQGTTTNHVTPGGIGISSYRISGTMYFESFDHDAQTHPPATAPNPPTSLSATAGDTEVDLVWVAPVNNGGSPITDYVIRRSANAGGSWTTVSDGTSTAVTYTDTGLTNDVTYRYEVAAVNAIGQSAWSTHYDVTPTAETGPVQPPSIPSGSYISPANYSSFVLTKPTGLVAGNMLLALMPLEDFGTTPPVFTCTSRPGWQVVSGLPFYDANQTMYFTAMWKIADAGDVAAANYTFAVNTGTPYIYPYICRITDHVGEPPVVVATWGDSSGAGANQIPAGTTSENGILLIGAGASWSSGPMAGSADANWLALPGTAPNGNLGYYRQQATAGSFPAKLAADNPANGIFVVLGVEGLPLYDTVPGAPTGLTAISGPSEVDLTWAAPSFNGNVAITDYIVQYRTTSGPGTWQTFSDGVSTALSASVTGLTNGVSYDFQVAAVNSEGTGAYSSIATAIPADATVTFNTLGAKVITGTTTLAIAYPSSLASDDAILACRVGWLSTATFSAETGWTSLGSRTGGTGTANDNHTSAVRVDRKDTVAGTESGTVTFDQGGTISGMIGAMISYRKAPSTATWSVVGVTGTDDAHAANRSVTADQGGPSSNGTLPLAPGDVLVAVVAVDTDAALASVSAPLFTASGITFDTPVRRTSGTGTGTGVDGNVEIFEAKVTAGTATVAPTFSFTTTTSQCGPIAIVRLRAVPV